MYRRRRIAEECKRIDIRHWRRLGYLKRPSRFTWSWSCGGESSGSIGVATEPGTVTLSYCFVEDDENRAPIREFIALESRPCRFGGQREYFMCGCRRLAEVLYLAAGGFMCRKCARVGYAIENLEKQWRADRRYRQLETQLNEDGSKPHRMRWATYNEICDRLERYDAISMEGAIRAMARLMRR